MRARFVARRKGISVRLGRVLELRSMQSRSPASTKARHPTADEVFQFLTLIMFGLDFGAVRLRLAVLCFLSVLLPLSILLLLNALLGDRWLCIYASWRFVASREALGVALREGDEL
jgi:hypothetical protein